MQVGEQIYAVGNPLGELTYTITSGIISALDRDITGEDGSTINMFQIDAAVNSGNSGGPVYNSRGEVIGVVTAKYSSTGVEGLGFAVPINDAAKIANELIKNGYVTGKAYMGVTVTTVSEQIAEYYGWVVGAYIRSVDSGSCAEKAGLKAGDIVTKLNDTAITSSADLIDAKKNYKAGDTVKLTIYRSGATQTLSLTFDEEKPKSPASTETKKTVPQPETGSGQGWPSFVWPFGY
jgi:serine protease Do